MTKQHLVQSRPTLPANDATVGPRKRPPVELRVHGADILLSGRFHRWQATAFTGTDLSQLSTRLSIDATSPDQLTIDPDQPVLLSFRSAKVRQIGPGIYRAKGDLVTTTGTHPLEIQIEMPEGHNAFFSVSFVADREILGTAWANLVIGESGAGGIDAERRMDPRAGVRDPELAAA